MTGVQPCHLTCSPAGDQEREYSRQLNDTGEHDEKGNGIILK